MSDKRGSRRAKLLALLEAVAHRRHDLPLAEFDGAEIDWIVRSGLGPMGFDAAKGNAENLASPHWSVLQAADLTARVIAGDQIEAMGEIIDAARGQVERLTLLKGVSLADECYPEFHLRPMRDIDVLVPRSCVPRLEGALRNLGYRQTRASRPGAYGAHHHTAPFFHAEKGVWVEVHHHLISAKNRSCGDPVFQLANVMAQSRPAVFRGREVYRLGAEFQLIYLAAHWAQEFHTVGGMIAAIDVIHLLNHHAGRLSWRMIFNWIEGSITASDLYLLLSYLDRRRLIDLPGDLLARLFLIQRRFGSWSLKAAHSLMDRYMLEGRDFGGVMSRRNLSVAWQTLLLPIPSPFKLLLIPLNLCMPFDRRIQ